MPEHWKLRPTGLYYWPDNIDYIMFVDENNHPSLKPIVKFLKNNKPIPDEERFFTVTGCIIEKNDFLGIKSEIMKIKHTYWEDGLFYYEKEKQKKRVCFHSHQIRKCQGPFSREVIDYEKFIYDLTDFIRTSPFIIISATINKEQHYLKYKTPQHPYNLCLDFLLERFGKFFLRQKSSNGIMHIEARGKKEDSLLLKHLVRKLENGTMWANSSELANIKGIYFNTKWCEGKHNMQSYLGLELADIISYPIHKFCRSGNRDFTYNVIESKFFLYPNYYGAGLKIFP